MSIRAAGVADLCVLRELMRSFYRDDELPFDEQTAGAALQRLLREPQWGGVWLAEEATTPVGYVVLCLGFALEFGGNDAFIDEVYVLPAHRGRGYGRALMQVAVAEAHQRDVRAVHLEVDRGNDAARSLYRALGFDARERYMLMTWRPE